ncbi:MAG: hypothetical protein IJ313_11800 [Clostridia bacterium]|nr:hypothetical protein [Clostridia bacterium]
MRTRIFCIALCVLTILLMLCSVQGMKEAMTPQGQPMSTVLRLACYTDESHPSTVTAQYFAELVSRQTQERIRIQVMPENNLGDESAAVEQLEFGGIAFAIVNCLSLSDDMLANGSDGTITLNTQALDLQRLDNLASFRPDYRCIASSEALITSDAECVGVNVGAYTAKHLTDRLKGYGFTIVPYSGDLVSSVYYGYIDSVELSLMTYATEDYSKTLPYLSFYDGLLAPDVLLASQVSMGNLAGDDQRIIRQCAMEAAQYQQTVIAEQQGVAIANLKGSGVEFYPPEIDSIPPADWDMLRGRFIGGGREDE